MILIWHSRKEEGKREGRRIWEKGLSYLCTFWRILAKPMRSTRVKFGSLWSSTSDRNGPAPVLTLLNHRWGAAGGEQGKAWLATVDLTESQGTASEGSSGFCPYWRFFSLKTDRVMHLYDCTTILSDDCRYSLLQNSTSDSFLKFCCDVVSETLLNISGLCYIQIYSFILYFE